MLGPLRVPALHSGPLCSFPQGPAAEAGDVRASVLARISDPVCGLLLLSFDPEDALALLARQGDRPRDASQALAGLRDLGARWLPVLAGAIGRELLEPVPSVSEDTLVGAVLSTHPPPDTRIVSISLQWPESGVGAVLLWLTHEKSIAPGLAGAGA